MNITWNKYLLSKSKRWKTRYLLQGDLFKKTKANTTKNEDKKQEGIWEEWGVGKRI